MIGIINYGMGNLGSIQNMLKKIGVKSTIVENPEELSEATKLILPGVGSFDNGIQRLRDDNWIPVLNDLVLDRKIPVLGICLGMQLMTNSSEEGNEEGLRWIDAQTVRFKVDQGSLRVPHMGWNIVRASSSENLLPINYEEVRFYHVHSYYVKLNDQNLEMASTTYGIKFTSAFHKDNIWGVQFHPEKSHKFGMELLRNFSQV